MKIPHRILMGTDFSDYAKEALDYAVLLAKHFGAELYLLHVFKEPIYIPRGVKITEPEFSDWIRSLREAEQKSLEALAGEVRRNGVVVHPMLKDGTAFREIPNAVKEVSADLIVLGTHGRTGLDRFMMGSVAERVARRVPCPILLVKPKALAEKDQEQP
jgi:nucleotide-binding universal stress UspA family protein